MQTTIKRYNNRKLYDTNQSCYVTLEEIGELVSSGQDIQVIDNSSKTDITAVTLLQVMFDKERKKVINRAEGAIKVEDLYLALRMS